MAEGKVLKALIYFCAQEGEVGVEIVTSWRGQDVRLVGRGLRRAAGVGRR